MGKLPLHLPTMATCLGHSNLWLKPKRNIKPIIGSELYLVKDRHQKAFSRAKGESDDRYHQLLLAKVPKATKIFLNFALWASSKVCTANIRASTRSCWCNTAKA